MEVRTEKIIQFGEGNFLRAFFDWIVTRMNHETDFNASVVVVQPRAGGHVAALTAQNCRYHVNLQGLSGGEPVDSIELIDCISRGVDPYKEFGTYIALAEQPEMRFIVSNTTEAGIAFDPSCSFDDKPAASYPGKLVQLLHHRYSHFNGDPDKGFIILPCELIFENGKCLKECILKYIDHWKLEDGFRDWFLNSCRIYSTLVDRIVPGYPKDGAEELTVRIGYEDKQLVKGEIFHLWVIEAPESLSEEFPADRCGLNVKFVQSEEPFHKRKVTLLNGPHTVLSPVGYLSGLDTVRECCEDPLVGRFVRKVMYDELLLTLDLPMQERISFADAVMERFRNPYIKHYVTSIMLNSFPKFKTRDLPGIKTFLEREGTLPQGLVFGLAAICEYYKGGRRGDDVIVPDDDAEVIALLNKAWSSTDPFCVARTVLSAEEIWGEDLTALSGFAELLGKDIALIEKYGMREALETIL
ncbi:MAG: tagaturonate reductase [Bacteroidales bacterium]|nr:tagaturonate reductase [Bacteroidales bacterium]